MLFLASGRAEATEEASEVIILKMKELSEETTTLFSRHGLRRFKENLKMFTS